MRGSFLTIGLMVLSLNTWAAIPTDKRTIYTSGSKVNLIRYQLGLSTILYFGSKPETVICGNKNYFNIEKIKEGVTIQPLSNFSTNLTVISGERQFLFYLMPAAGARPDGFIDVKWVPSNETRAIKPVSRAKEIVRELNQKIKLSKEAEATVLREISLEGGKRKIWELNLKNIGSRPISTLELEIMASQGGIPFQSQASVWEADTVSPQKNLRGRVIASQVNGKSISLIIGFRGKSVKVFLRGGGH